MKRWWPMVFLCLLASVFCLETTTAGGGDMPEYAWQEIRSAAGGASLCRIITVGDTMDMAPPVTAFFDAKGVLVKFQTGGMIREFSYDAASRLKEIRESYQYEGAKPEPGPRTAYVWDAAGALVSIDMLDGTGAKIQSQKVVVENGMFVIDEEFSRNVYDRNLNLIETDSYFMDGKTRKVGMRTVYAYDARGNVATRTIDIIDPGYESPVPQYIQKFIYTFDAAGNKTSVRSEMTPAPQGGLAYMLAKPAFSFEYVYGETPAVIPDKGTTGATGPAVGQKVQVKWNDGWFPAVILKVDGDKYLIHYDGYDASWDEWVTAERLKF